MVLVRISLMIYQRTGLRRKPIEVIGTYDAIPKPPPPGVEGKLVKDVELDFDRAKYWLGVGAQPSDAVARIFIKVDIISLFFFMVDIHFFQ